MPPLRPSWSLKRAPTNWCLDRGRHDDRRTLRSLRGSNSPPARRRRPGHRTVTLTSLTTEQVLIIAAGARGRKFSEADKRRIVEEAVQPGASLSEVARRYGIAARVLFHLEAGAVSDRRTDLRHGTDRRRVFRCGAERRGTCAMTLLPPGVKVHLAFGYTDMRKGIDGLAMLVQSVLRAGSVLGPPVRVPRLESQPHQDRVLGWDWSLPLHQRLEQGVFL